MDTDVQLQTKTSSPWVVMLILHLSHWNCPMDVRWVYLGRQCPWKILENVQEGCTICSRNVPVQ